MSDTQPDPYIDAMAAEHTQEYEPDDRIREAAAAERERIAAAIEAMIVADPADRYARWPSREGETSYPDACAHALNSVTTQDGYEEQWPVIQAGMFHDALEPVILRAAAGIARRGDPEVLFQRHEECTPSLCAVCSACGLHIADDAEAWKCLKCGPLRLAAEEEDPS